MVNYKTAPTFQQAIQDRYYGGTSTNAAVVGGLTPIRAHSLVPWLFRAVDWRAMLVANMPFALMAKGKEVAEDEVTERPEYASIIQGHRRRMYRTEASKVLTGAAYWAIEANAAGRNVTPRWLIPGAISPQSNSQDGLTHFQFSGQHARGLPSQIPLDRMVWFWNDNFESEVLPGSGEGAVALAAASMLHALDAFTANFFNQGAVKVTVFPVPQGTQEPEIKKLENFLARRMASVRNAFRMLVLRQNDKMTPYVIGSDIKDTQAVELTEQQRQNAAVALGVPPNVLSGTYKYATADSELTGFFQFTIIPEVEMLYERANEQFYSRFDLEIVAKPEETEIMQAAQLSQVEAVTSAVGKPVLTIDEGRDLLGYDPLTAAQKDELAPPPPVMVPGVGSDGKPVTVGEKPAPKEAPKDDEAEPAMDGKEGKALPAHPGAMLAFMLDRNVSALLGSIGGYTPDHMTLLFLAQDASTLDKAQLAALGTVLKNFAKRNAPFVVTVSGVGRFETSESDGTNAIYASVDSPCLPGFREDLLRAVRATGIEPVTNHGFSPHITLGYINAMLPTPAIAMPNLSLSFDTVSLIAAGKRTDFLLTGVHTYKAVEGEAAEAADPGMSTEMVDDDENVKKALTSWRKAAVDNFKQAGSHFVLPSIPNLVPDHLALPINSALELCKTPADVRAVFAKHWPKPRKAVEPTPAQMLAALERATAAAERLAA